jgi:uncharacterized FlaG/YvyC family protein
MKSPNSTVMDIKGIVRQVIPFTTKAQQSEMAAKARSLTDASGDREGNGQSAQSGSEEKKRDYTPEEIQDVVKYLESLSGVKDNGLTVRTASADGVTVILIEDRTGKTVRRIPEVEFGTLLANRAKGPTTKTTGNLLNRAL